MKNFNDDIYQALSPELERYYELRCLIDLGKASEEEKNEYEQLIDEINNKTILY